MKICELHQNYGRKNTDQEVTTLWRALPKMPRKMNKDWHKMTSDRFIVSFWWSEILLDLTVISLFRAWEPAENWNCCWNTTSLRWSLSIRRRRRKRNNERQIFKYLHQQRTIHQATEITRFTHYPSMNEWIIK